MRAFPPSPCDGVQAGKPEAEAGCAPPGSRPGARLPGSRDRQLYLACFAFRAVQALLLQTYFAPDEQWQSVEVAHRLVFGCAGWKRGGGGGDLGHLPCTPQPRGSA